MRKIILVITFVMLMIPLGGFSMERKPTIFLGQILEIQRDEKHNNLRLLVEGYISGCETYKETLIAVVGENTAIVDCNDNVLDFSYLKITDSVYIELSEMMTKSIPPQSFAEKIKVNYKKQ